MTKKLQQKGYYVRRLQETHSEKKDAFLAESTDV